ncbi:MAG: histidine phosphatase family protein [Actinobacteria bacterium]|nr:histidine phosphatase family protein [Actinomycetota bacterium]
MTTILLTRHGETDWNLQRRVQGHVDRPLNDRGREQARALAEELRDEHFDAVYSSDLARAQETAAIVARHRGLDVSTLPALREKNFGSWEGLTDAEVLSRYPAARSGPWGDGESTEEVADRVMGAILEISERHPDARVLVVTHGGPIRAVLSRAHVNGGGNASARVVVDNCAVNIVEIRDAVLRVPQVDLPPSP